MTATEPNTQSTEGAGPTTPSGGGLSEERRRQLEDEVAGLRIKTSTNETDRRNGTIGLAVGVIGVLLCLGAFLGSAGSTDSRDQNDFIILALGGVALTVGGSIAWLRFSLGSLLRLWLVRLVYEQREQTDRLLSK